MRIRLAGLLPGTDYNVQLRSSDGQNVSGWSRIFELTTISDNIPPKTPANFTWAVSGTSFVGQWDEVTESTDDTPILDFDHYELQLWNGSQFVYYKTKSTTFTLTFEHNRSIFGAPAPQVWARVRAVDDSGNESAFTSQLLATNAVPDPPTSFVATGIFDAVVLSWEEPADDDIKGYSVHLSTSDSGFTPNAGNRVWFGRATSLTYPSTLYSTHYFKIATVDVFDQNSSYVADDAAPLSSSGVDGDPPDIPTSLSVSGALNAVDAGRADFTLTWTDPSDTDLAGIVVRWRANGETPYNYINVPAGAQTTVVRNLWTGVQYDFQIAAFDFSANYSAYTAVESETVNNAAPSKPSEATLVGSIQQFGVTHDLTKDAGGRLESDVRALDIYVGTTATWATASPVKLQTIPVAAGSNVAVSTKIPLALTDPTPSRWIYVIAVDEGGLESPESDPTALTVDALTGDYFEDVSIASAKIQNLDANKITAGTGIINDLDVKSTLTVGDGVDPGVIQSYEYLDSLGTAGYSLTDSGLIIKTGQIEAAALKIQNSQNLLPPEYADFEFYFEFYDSDTLIIPAETTVDIIGADVRFGVQSLEVVCTAATERNLDFAPPGTYNVNIDGGAEYIASAYVYQNSGTAKDFKLLLAWDDATSSYSSAISVPDDAWTRISFVATAPVAAVKARAGVAFGDPFTFIIDGVQVEKKIGQLDTPSQWKPPSSTSIDGGIIRTGEIRSSSNVTVAEEQVPSWSINTQGNAQFGDAIVRGKLLVGLEDFTPPPAAAFRSSSSTHSPTTSARSNLLTNPGFETASPAMDGWEATGGSVARSTTSSRTGSANALLTPNGSSAEAVLRTTIAASPSVTPGNTYSFSAYVRSAAGFNFGNVVRRIEWLDGSNNVISVLNSSSSTAHISGYSASSLMSAIAPEGAAKIRVSVVITGTPSASLELRVDDTEVLDISPFVYQVAKPSGVVSGDVLIAFQSTSEIRPETAPDGWGLLGQAFNINVKTAVWWKMANGSEPANYDFYQPYDESGVGTTSIIAVENSGAGTPVIAVNLGPSVPNPPGVDTPATFPSNGGLEIRHAAAVVTVSEPWTTTGFTQREDLIDNVDYIASVTATRTRSGPGGTGTHFFANDDADNRAVGITVNVLNPVDEDLGETRAQSGNYIPGTSGWKLASDGSAEFGDISIHGFGRINVGDYGSPQVVISSQFFGETSAEMGIATGHQDEVGYASIWSGITESGGESHPALRLSAGRFGDVVPLMSIINEGPTTGVTNYPQITFHTLDDGSMTTEQGLFWVTDVYRAFFGGSLEVILGIKSVKNRPTEAEDDTVNTINNTSYFHNTNGVGFSFVAPPSGIVRVDRYAGLLMTLSANVSRSVYGSWEMREGGTVGSGTLVVSPLDNNGVYCRVGAVANMEEATRATAHKHVTGLTPGATYNVRTMIRVASATTGGTFEEFYRRLTVTPCL